MNLAAVVGSMMLCILLGSCAILGEFHEYAPDDISDRKYCAIIIGWGFFAVSAVGLAANGIF